MKQLFLDTSNQYLYLAVLENNHVLFEHKQVGNNNHSETLISVIEECFSKNNITVDDICEIFVGRGPGSYTGVRVACTVAKVLAYSKNIKLRSFSSLDLLLTTALKPGLIVCKMDTRRGFSYAKVFNVSDTIQEVSKEEYVETILLEEKYSDAFVITNESSNYNPLLILKYKLYQEVEDVHSFVPTYLRSGV
ncbi:MAG: tRNA (adenosine(37)-N6)-threonylcarbamoyltransferase complex dimerization subunit type 1 TsaB [Bacilli bacterium]|nr:tRNA (adenosine(37)-N6)-threonylcarbamoyltransferase complex dimerization subunit type 1 TsaB [Bacilli bacterium]